MQYTFPNYYKEFSCIAGACPDTCCAGWQIVIDDQTLKKYQHFKGPFRNRLHNDIDWKQHVFRQYNRRCAFLNEENLCDIYTEAGPEMFCRTCRNYPRHIEEFEGLREISLSLSCPEAARILLSQKEKVHFITKEKKTKEEVYDDFDYFLFTALMDTRDMLIDIIQDRAVPMQKRLWKLLAAAHDFQLCVNKNELFKWEEMRKRHEDSGYGDRFCNKIYSRINADNIENSSAASACANTPEQLFKKMWKTVVPEMEVLRPGWQEYTVNQIDGLVGTVAQEDFLFSHTLNLADLLLQFNLQRIRIAIVRVIIWIFVGVEEDAGISACKLRTGATVRCQIPDVLSAQIFQFFHFSFKSYKEVFLQLPVSPYCFKLFTLSLIALA